MKLYLLVATNDVSKTLNIYNEIIQKTIEKFGGFTIINFSNILKKNKDLIYDKKNISILRNKYGEKINYLNPINEQEFLENVERDQVIGIDSIGKSFNFFSIRRLIKKKNIKLILIMNLGYVSNELSYPINNLNGHLFKLKKKVNNFIYKFLVIIKFLPNIFIYFESRKDIYENCINNKKTKLSLFLPFLNIKYFENVYKINSNSYTNYLKNKNSLEEKNIIFLDGNFKHEDILSRQNLNVIELKKKYFHRLDIFFKWIENIFKQKVEICLHPSSNANEYKSFFKDRIIWENFTNEKIIKSFIVIFHESSAILDALVYKKKIISLNTSLFGEYMANRIFYYKKKLNLFSIELDNHEHYKNYKHKDILNSLQNSIKNYDNYIYNYMKSDNEELGTDKIIRILKRYK